MYLSTAIKGVVKKEDVEVIYAWIVAFILIHELKKEKPSHGKFLATTPEYDNHLLNVKQSFLSVMIV